MSSNILIILFVLGSVVLGAVIGYFVFLGVYQEQFAQQDRITLANFESATVVLTGAIQSVEDNEFVLEYEGIRFSIEFGGDTEIIIPIPKDIPGAQREAAATGRGFVQDGTKEDLVVEKMVRVSAVFLNEKFEALQVIVISDL